MTIRVLSYNIHKGFQTGGAKFVLPEIRELIRELKVDIVLLQEVVGENQKRAVSTKRWPSVSQYEYLAEEIWPNYSYGLNSAYPTGHHGNAVLSRFPITTIENTDISTNRLERRGFLHTEITIPETQQTIHVCCTHLDLTERGQDKQVRQVARLIRERVKPGDKLIFGGDFNDWRNRLSGVLEDELGLSECVKQKTGKLVPTFPAMFPLLSLDRIYVQGLQVCDACIIRRGRWRELSDHLPVCADLKL